MSPAGEALEGNCPFEGACKAKAALAAGAGDKRKAARSLESGLVGSRPACRSGVWVVSCGLSACLPEVSLTFLVVSLPDRGRRVLLGAGRPTEHPLPSPAGNPAGLPARRFPNPLGFWEKPASRFRSARHPAACSGKAH